MTNININAGGREEQFHIEGVKVVHFFIFPIKVTTFFCFLLATSSRTKWENEFYLTMTIKPYKIPTERLKSYTLW